MRVICERCTNLYVAGSEVYTMGEGVLLPLCRAFSLEKQHPLVGIQAPWCYTTSWADGYLWQSIVITESSQWLSPGGHTEH